MCWKCGKKIEINRIIGRSDVCPYCGADVRCCRNCRFYEAGSHYDCYEAVDELVKDKEKANFCGWFMLAPQPADSSAGKNASDGSCGAGDSASSPAADKPVSGAAAFNALFGEKTDDKPASSGKDAFNALFGD